MFPSDFLFFYRTTGIKQIEKMKTKCHNENSPLEICYLLFFTWLTFRANTVSFTEWRCFFPSNTVTFAFTVWPHSYALLTLRPGKLLPSLARRAFLTTRYLHHLDDHDEEKIPGCLHLKYLLSDRELKKKNTVTRNHSVGWSRNWGLWNFIELKFRENYKKEQA